MQIHWTYDGCDELNEFQIERCWETRQLELEGKLASLSDEPRELRIAVHRVESNPEWEIQAALYLPGRTLVADSTATTVEACLDQMLYALACEIDDTEEAPVRVSERRRGVEAIVPFLEQSYVQRRGDAFISFLVPLVQATGSYVQREIRIRELEGVLPMEGVSTADVLDELLLSAWETFDRRPKELAFDVWLFRLADVALEKLGGPLAQMSLDDEQPEPTMETREAERDEWIEQATYPETIELGELLSGASIASRWDQWDTQAKQTILAEALSKLPREGRQALVLHLADGFSEAEIADFQQRPVSEVVTDIAAAQQAIRLQLSEPELEEVEEEMQRQARRQSRHRRR